MVEMVLEKLGESLSGVIRRITRAGALDEKLVKELVREIQRALLSSDVNVKLVLELSRRIEERMLREKPPAGLSRREHAVKVVYEEILTLLGGKAPGSMPSKARIMMVGLQGSGKTTTTAKIARYFQKRGLRTAIIAADTQRPAAYEQLVQLVEKYRIPVLRKESRSAAEIVRHAMKEGGKADILILDTAGRHRSEEELFDEMEELARIFEPDEKLLVIDASMGQQAGAQAEAFSRRIGITGVVLTKLDGSARGGGALSAVAATGAPVRFIGTGERIDDIEEFNPERFISRLLGMGDIQALIEKAKESMDESAAKDILKGDFTLDDLYSQIESLRKMGPLSGILSMLPGFGGGMPKEVAEITESRMRRFLVIMDSMTREERRNPKIINASRVRRIAMGSGSRVEDVKELLRYHATMKKAIKSFKKGRGRGFTQLARMMRGMKI